MKTEHGPSILEKRSKGCMGPLNLVNASQAVLNGAAVAPRLLEDAREPHSSHSNILSLSRYMYMYIYIYMYVYLCMYVYMHIHVYLPI